MRTAMDSNFAHGTGIGTIVLGWLLWCLSVYPPVIGALATTAAFAFYCYSIYEKWRASKRPPE